MRSRFPCAEARPCSPIWRSRRRAVESREVLLDLLWPDRFKEQAQASLRQVLFELRAAAGDSAAIVDATRTSVALGSGIVECDVWELERQSVPQWARPASSTCFGSIAAPCWMARRSARSRSASGWRSSDRGSRGGSRAPCWRPPRMASSADEQERAVQALRRLIELSPMCAPAVLRLMSIEAASGRRQDALLQYERYAKRLKLEFDEEPPAELRQAYEAMKAAPQETRIAAVSLRRPAYRAQRSLAAHTQRCPGARGPALPLRGRRRREPRSPARCRKTSPSFCPGCRWFSVCRAPRPTASPAARRSLPGISRG